MTLESIQPLRVGLALGGGGARGWAHIGAIRALQELGIRPDVVCGTSMGAAIGASFALGTLDALEAWALRLDRRTVLSLFDFSLRGGLIRAGRVFDELTDILPDTMIEDLKTPFAAVATDLKRGSEVWLRDGPLRSALRASIAYPGLISPTQVRGRWMVDGGLVNPVPVSLARALGADVVIAVEVSVAKSSRFGFRTSTSIPLTAGPVGWEDPSFLKPASSRSFFDSLSDLSERFWGSPSSEEETHRPSVYEVIGQSLHVMQTRITRSILAGDPPELHIIPRLQGVGLMDFDRAGTAIDEGYNAVHVAAAAQAEEQDRRTVDES